MPAVDIFPGGGMLQHLRIRMDCSGLQQITGSGVNEGWHIWLRVKLFAYDGTANGNQECIICLATADWLNLKLLV